MNITTHSTHSKTWIRSDLRYWSADTNTSGRLGPRREHTYGSGRSSAVSSNTFANIKHSTAPSFHILDRPHSRARKGTFDLERSDYSVCSCPGSWAHSYGCSTRHFPRILRLTIYIVILLKIKKPKTKMCSTCMNVCFQIYDTCNYIQLFKASEL